jgi:hypothetical protein
LRKAYGTADTIAAYTRNSLGEVSPAVMSSAGSEEQSIEERDDPVVGEIPVQAAHKLTVVAVEKPLGGASAVGRHTDCVCRSWANDDDRHLEGGL